MLTQLSKLYLERWLYKHRITLLASLLDRTISNSLLLSLFLEARSLLE